MLIKVDKKQGHWKNYCKHIPNRTKKKEIIVMCGPSNCGKSTYIRSLPFKYTVINSDTIRLKCNGSTKLGSNEATIWSIFHKHKMLALKRGENIILDACHISHEARWHSLNLVPKRYKKICVIFNVKLKTVKSRCNKSWAISMWQEFKRNKPSTQELLYYGFNKVVKIKGEEVI